MRELFEFVVDLITLNVWCCFRFHPKYAIRVVFRLPKSLYIHSDICFIKCTYFMNKWSNALLNYRLAIIWVIYFWIAFYKVTNLFQEVIMAAATDTIAVIVIIIFFKIFLLIKIHFLNFLLKIIRFAFDCLISIFPEIITLVWWLITKNLSTIIEGIVLRFFIILNFNILNLFLFLFRFVIRSYYFNLSSSEWTYLSIPLLLHILKHTNHAGHIKRGFFFNLFILLIHQHLLSVKQSKHSFMLSKNLPSVQIKLICYIPEIKSDWLNYILIITQH